VIAAVQQALAREGRVGVRAWGDVTSVELAREGRVVFSFQVAARSGRLRPPFRGLWPGGVAVDSLEDLVASKMVALVNRGAPRDFRDIHAVVTAGLMDAMQCWSLWEERQRLSGEDADPGRARLAVRSHLARIEVARPLPSIADEAERARAADVRRWITTELLHEPAD
jgi:predicted nucleotidyltransferase component of viral defense system